MGTIEMGSDGEPVFHPGPLETEAMMRKGHEEFWAGTSHGGSPEGGDDEEERPKSWLQRIFGGGGQESGPEGGQGAGSQNPWTGTATQGRGLSGWGKK